MKDASDLKITLVGAAGMSFGPVMVHDAIHSPKIAGSRLVLHDIDEARLAPSFAAAQRLNKAAGSPIRLEMETRIPDAYEDADYIILSVERDRFKGWEQDYTIPIKHGSTQIMGENGGPGGMFHSLRSIKTCLEVCENIKNICPDAYLLNLTNPMSRVTLAINLGTDIRNVGLCHEFHGGLLRLAMFLLLPMNKIAAKASGINHFTFFYDIRHADTDKDLYPRLERHFKMFPFLYPPLVRHMFKEYGLMATSTDSHIGEYVPFAKKVVGRHMDYYKFFQNEGDLRCRLTKAYGEGMLPLPIHRIPRSMEQVFPIIEGLATGDRTYLDGVNVPNKGYVPNLPEGAIVEVPAWTGDRDLEPETVPAIHPSLAELMTVQVEIQELVVKAALERDPAAALQAVIMDPLSPPDESKCKSMFDEMMALQADYLSFD